MNLHQEYQAKLVTPEEAVKAVKSGDWVDYTTNVCGETSCSGRFRSWSATPQESISATTPGTALPMSASSLIEAFAATSP